MVETAQTARSDYSSVAARDVRPGMVVRVRHVDYEVVGSVPTSSARHSITWRLGPGRGNVDFWVGDPSTPFWVKR